MFHPRTFLHIACCAPLFLAVAAPAFADDVQQLKKEVDALRAQVQSLQAELNQLKRNVQPGPVAVSEADKKWITQIHQDFFAAIFANKMDLAKQLATQDLRTAKADSYFGKPVLDPYVKVKQDWGIYRYAQKEHFRTDEQSYAGPRKVTIDLLFDKYTTGSETFSPNGKEVVVTGTLTGNKKLPASDNFEDKTYTINRLGSYKSTIVTEGKVGPRTGSFVLRLVRATASERWEICYFHWELTKPAK